MTTYCCHAAYFQYNGRLQTAAKKNPPIELNTTQLRQNGTATIPLPTLLTNTWMLLRY